MPELSYPQALSWLYARNQFSIKLGLDATRELLGALGNPERGGNYLHVAGTNGKGSVCANLAAMLAAVEGGPVGLYTSPHLVSFRERIRVDGAPIPARAVADWMNEALPRLEALNPTYFECVTALAFAWFRRNHCRSVVLETGLGGRLDATNVVAPRVAVITSISLDHTAYLGDTLEAIQGEKLGIAKAGVPLVVDEPREGLGRRAEEKARELGAPFLNLADRLEEGEGEVAWTVRGAHRAYLLPADLRAERHQMRNAALAVLALEAYFGKSLPREDVWMPALRAARVPGRTQELASREENLLPVLLDGAHNPAGIEALRAVLARREAREETRRDGGDGAHSRPGARLRIFFATMRDKEFVPVFQTLRALSDDIVYLDLASKYPRALTAEELRAETSPEGGSVREAALSWEAIAPLLQTGSGADHAVFCGSLFLVGEVIPLLMPHYRGLEEFEELAGDAKAEA